MIMTLSRKLIDLAVTFLLWIYFVFGFLLAFAPVAGWFFISKKSGESDYQGLFHHFFRSFFKLLHVLAPGLKISIDPKLSSIRSSIIVCNHQSYLDPLLLIANFNQHKTIVKNSFFNVPFFGWLMKQAGYIPSSANGKYMALVVRHIGSMKDYLAKGGILFVFPEGTRSRNGNLNEFNKGAFNIAGQCQAPVNVVYIKGTDRWFKPGTGLFNTCHRTRIEVIYVGTIYPAHSKSADAAKQLAEKARQMIREHMKLG